MNTNYYNFNPSPCTLIEYSYEFFLDGTFGVNIYGLILPAKDFAYYTFDKFLYYLETKASESNGSKARGLSIATVANQRESAGKVGHSVNPIKSVASQMISATFDESDVQFRDTTKESKGQRSMSQDTTIVRNKRKDK
jgi:hypothetical protein